MSKSAIVREVAENIAETSIGKTITKEVAEEMAESLVAGLTRQVEAEIALRGLKGAALAEELIAQGLRNADASLFIRNIDGKNTIVAELATKGVGGLPDVILRTQTAEAKVVIVQTGDVVKTTGKSMDTLSNEGVKAAGGEKTLWEKIKANPKMTMLGIGAAGVGIYIAVEAAMGVSPGDALKKLFNFVGDAAREVAGLMGGLANSFLGGALGNIWGWLKWVLIAVAVLVVLFFAFKIVMGFMNKRKGVGGTLYFY